MTDFVSIIKDFGFPIACVIALFLMLMNEQKSHKEETEKLTETITDLKITFAETIRNQESKLTEAINNNTLVLQKLIDRIDKEDGQT